MSNYSDASLVMYPSGRKATKLYSQKPTDGTGDFTVARAGLRHEINSDLKLELIAANVPAFNYDAIGGCPVLNTEPQSTNLITYPVSFGNSYWTKSGASIEGDATTAGSELLTNGTFTGSASSWTLGAGVAYGTNNLTFTAATSNTSNTTPSLTINKMYLVTYEVTNYTSGTFWANLGGTASGATNSGNGTFTDYITTSVGTNILYFSGSGFSGTLDNISVKEVQGYSAPSVDFPTSAFKLVEDTTLNNHQVYASNVFTSVLNNYYSLSFFAKSSERTNVSCFLQIPNAINCDFDLINKTAVVSSGAGVGKIEEIADGWFKCSLSGQATSAGGVYTNIVLSNGSVNNYTGDGTSGLYIFMAQAEDSSVATSPTFTDITLAAEGSTSTRLADLQYITAANSTAWDFTSEDFSFVFDVNFSDISVGPYLYSKGRSVNDGWNIIVLSTGAIRVLSSQSGANQVTDSSVGVATVNTDLKIVVTRSGTVTKIYKNGALIVTGTNTAPDTAVARDLVLGNYYDFSKPVNGDISSFKIYTTELTATQVAAL